LHSRVTLAAGGQDSQGLRAPHAFLPRSDQRRRHSPPDCLYQEPSDAKPMSATTNLSGATSYAEESDVNYLNNARGFASWAFTLDHKRIGIMYLVGILASFLLGGILALLVRLHLWTPEGMLVSNDWYNQLFTLHGAAMT